MQPKPIGTPEFSGASPSAPAQITSSVTGCAQRLARAHLNQGGNNLSVLPPQFFENRQSANLLMEFATVLGDRNPVYVGLWSPGTANNNAGSTKKIIKTLNDKSSAVMWVMQADGTLIMGCKPNPGDMPLKHSVLATLNKSLVEKIDSLTQTGNSYESLLDDPQLFKKLTEGAPDQVVSAGTMWINNNPDLNTRELIITNESGHFEPSAVSARSIESFQTGLVKTLNDPQTGNPLKVVYKTYRPGDAA